MTRVIEHEQRTITAQRKVLGNAGQVCVSGRRKLRKIGAWSKKGVRPAKEKHSKFTITRALEELPPTETREVVKILAFARGGRGKQGRN